MNMSASQQNCLLFSSYILHAQYIYDKILVVGTNNRYYFVKGYLKNDG